MKNLLHKKPLSPTRAIRRFGFRQTIRGALIVGLIIGIMMGAQGFAYAEAYPNQHARDTFAASLASVPSLGFMAGEIQNARLPETYAIYKSITVVTTLTTIWGLLVATRLLRGQEEDDRWETVVSGAVSKRQAGLHILTGFGYSFVISFLIAWILIAAMGAPKDVGLSIYESLLMTLAVFLPGLVFVSVGVFVSQLAITRQRALFYGLLPLLFFYMIRGAGNSVVDLNWLKQWSPFGWSDLLNPVLDPQLIWIVPPIIITVILGSAGIYLIAKRDLGAGLLRQSLVARSHFWLLNSSTSFSIRQTITPFFWWTIGTIAYTSMLAALTNIAVEALKNSPAFVQLIGTLGGSTDDLKIAFIGFGAVFTVLILLAMATTFVAGIRREEAMGYLDNLLVRPVRRSVWLSSRLFVTIVMITTISLLVALTIWTIVSSQGIKIDLSFMMQGSIALVGPIIFTLGFGAFLYGVLPRIAVIGMSAVILWAFLVDVLQSVFKLDDIIIKSSLLHYIDLSPTQAPDWQAFAWLTGIGILLAIVGIIGFTKRDIITE